MLKCGGMFDNFIVLVTAIVFANALSAMLIWGIVRAARIYSDDELDVATACCILLPVGAVLLGLLYLKFS